jgi:hypothetical protein
LNSAFWHRFVLTRHSGVFANPQKYEISIPERPPNIFANNDIEHIDTKGGDHDLFDDVLPYSLNLWMRGQNLDVPIWKYFDRNQKLPKIKIPKNFVTRHLQNYRHSPVKENSIVLWLGGQILEMENGIAIFRKNGNSLEIAMEETLQDWLFEQLATLQNRTPIRYSDFIRNMPNHNSSTKLLKKLRKCGLIYI